MSPEPVAVYRRTVHASLERVWENVLDWEHLPWLHRHTFAHVRLLERRADGWRAETSTRAAQREPFVVDVTIDRDARVYHSRTTSGPGSGTDIVTRLTPAGDRCTDIEVGFIVPGVSSRRVGERYVALYTTLWDEDEAMMVRRQSVLDGQLEPAFHMTFVDGRPVWHATVCPHLGGPLEDVPIVDGCITCPWHGYRFDVHTGHGVNNPLRLPCPPGA
jgi:nitrite reductase/ring-hydroxylating ferredoxin subunit